VLSPELETLWPVLAAVLDAPVEDETPKEPELDIVFSEEYRFPFICCPKLF
jgi:hypothetical protein